VQAVTYVAMAPKSNATIRAIDAALSDVRSRRVLPVPVHLRDAHYPGAKRLGHGEGYQYAHDAPRAGSTRTTSASTAATTSRSTADLKPNSAGASKRSANGGRAPNRMPNDQLALAKRECDP